MLWGRESNIFSAGCYLKKKKSPFFILSQQMVTKTSSTAEFHGSIRWMNSEPSRPQSVSLAHGKGRVKTSSCPVHG